MSRENYGVQIVLRIPTSLDEKLDSFEQRTGLTRSQVVRLALAKLTDDDIPASFMAHADALRPAQVR